MLKRILVAILAILLTSSLLSAAQTLVSARGGSQKTLTMAMTTEADGSLASTDTDYEINGEVDLVEITFGATAPDTGTFDFYLKTSTGIDILGGQGVNITTTGPHAYFPYNGVAYGSYPVTGDLTLTIAGNTTNAAQFNIIVKYRSPV